MTYVPARGRLEAAKKQAERGAANTFAVYADRYLTARDLRPKTEQEYRRLLTRDLLPAFGDRPLKAITTAEVRDWHVGLPDTPSMNAASYRRADELRDELKGGVLAVHVEVPEHPHGVVRLDDGVPVVDQPRVHLRNGRERRITGSRQLQRPGMPEVLVRGEPR